MISVSSPSVWNSLPAHVRSIDNLCTFKRHLKSHLFRQLSLLSHSVQAPPIRSSRVWRSINLVVCMYVYDDDDENVLISVVIRHG